jgi:hypothetical protein
MAQSHTWFATDQDVKLILAWLQEAGALFVGSSIADIDRLDTGRKYILHFPSIGPIEYWPDEIQLDNYRENSPEWRKAVLISHHIKESPNVRQVNADRSACAGFQLPEWRDEKFWVAGEVWFPGSRLRDSFPELARICQ